MEYFRNFLESSSIHGLSYISTTRKLAKILWILTVIAGFTGAGLLIYESFETWQESPVKTTIETLPIEEITFPKVTVCPPKNTYTNLNFDLISAKNMTFSLKERYRILQYTVELLHEPYYTEGLKNTVVIQEENKHSNWYHGYTKIVEPYYYENCLFYDFLSSATKGSVKTINFGDTYNYEKLNGYLTASVVIHVPRSVRRMKNVTLYFEIEKISVENLTITTESRNTEDYSVEGYSISPSDSNFTVNYTMNGKSSYSFSLLRKISEDHFEKFKNSMKFMPGFKLSWHYNVNIEPDNRFTKDSLTKSYVR